MDKFNEFREKYENFIYDGFNVEELSDSYKIIYNFKIEGLTCFNPSIEISKKYLKTIGNIEEYFLFHIGLVELISYWKCCCCKNVIINGYLDENQIQFFKKLYYYGLGEFFYVNNINVDYETFMNIKINGKKSSIPNIEFNGNGCLIPIGGGKDSCVSLELLKNYENNYFILNPKQVMYDCIEANNGIDKVITVKRTIDKKLLELNDLGYLNGHTPFSAYLAFMTYFVAYLTGKKYITLSNEGSANEATVLGTKINHQYSKTYEFENDFNEYTKKYFNIDITYFSFLRPLSELQIAMLFANYKKYHKAFKSCNVGSKKVPWVWCCDCAKCLFVYIILSPYLYKNELISIFGEDLYEKESLLNTFIELTGNAKTKPFECVGTTKEVRFCVSYLINKLKKDNIKLPFLLDYYDKNYLLFSTNVDLLKEYNEENNLPEEFSLILKEALEKCMREL